MSLHVKCGHCGKHCTAPERLAGRTAKCPACGGSVTIPAIADAAAPTAKPVLTSLRDVPPEPVGIDSPPDLFGQDLPSLPAMDDFAEPTVWTKPRPRSSFLSRLKSVWPAEMPVFSLRHVAFVVAMIVVVSFGCWLWQEMLPEYRNLYGLLVIVNLVLGPLFLIAGARRYLRTIRLICKERGAPSYTFFVSRYYLWQFARTRRAQLREPSWLFRWSFRVVTAELTFFACYVPLMLVIKGPAAFAPPRRPPSVPVVAHAPAEAVPPSQGSPPLQRTSPPVDRAPADPQLKQMAETANAGLPKQTDAITTCGCALSRGREER